MQLLRFGTDGIRGSVTSDIFSPKVLAAFAQAVEQWLKEKYGITQGSNLIIASDTRESSSAIKERIAAGLSSASTLYDAGILPTPAIALLLKTDHTFDAGIVISASHNHYLDNGIKIFTRAGEKLNEGDEHIIENYCIEYQKHRSSNTGAAHLKVFKEAAAIYKQKLLNQITSDFSNISLVIDCAHGATSFCAPELFKALPTNLTTVGAQPDGKNINQACGALAPTLLQKTVLDKKATVGFAFDGDGDRLMVVTKNGIIRDGDDLLFWLSQSKQYAQQKKIVGTVMTNQGLENALHVQGKELIRTPVGDKYIHRQLKEHALLLGGEPSGHIIMHDYLSTGDGILTALRLLECMYESNNYDLDSYEKFPQCNLSLAIVKRHNLSASPIADIIKSHNDRLQGGRLLVRYSGTENLLRIMTEAQSYDLAHETAQALSHELVKHLV